MNNQLKTNDDTDFIRVILQDNEIIKVWNLPIGFHQNISIEDAKLLMTIKKDNFGEKMAVSFQEKLIASVNRNIIKIWNFSNYVFDNNKQPIHILDGHCDDESIYCLAFSPDGKWLASSRCDGSTDIWDMTTGNSVFKFSCCEPVDMFVFSPNNKWIAVATDDQSRIDIIDINDITNGDSGGMEFDNRFNHIHDIDVEVNTFAFSPDSKRIAIGYNSGRIEIINPITSQLIYTLQAHNGPIFKLVFFPNRNRLASIGKNASIKIWDLKIFKLVQKIKMNDICLDNCDYEISKN